MIRSSLLLAATAAALALSANASARPMTATDMHMMHRLGAPQVSPDGRWALFTISDTDLKANKRNNRLHMLGLSRAGAQPQPVAGTNGASSAVFGLRKITGSVGTSFANSLACSA